MIEIGFELHSQGEQSLGGWPIGPMQHQTPSPRPRRLSDGIAMGGEPANIFVAERLSLSDAQPRRRIDVDEFGVPEKGKSPRPDRRS